MAMRENLQKRLTHLQLPVDMDTCVCRRHEYLSEICIGWVFRNRDSVTESLNRMTNEQVRTTSYLPAASAALAWVDEAIAFHTCESAATPSGISLMKQLGSSIRGSLFFLISQYSSSFLASFNSLWSTEFNRDEKRRPISPRVWRFG